MQICVNGKIREVTENCTLAQLLEELELSGRFAVELNEEIVPRSAYPEVAIRAGDRLEIVHAIGGGAAPADAAGLPSPRPGGER